MTLSLLLSLATSPALADERAELYSGCHALGETADEDLFRCGAIIAGRMSFEGDGKRVERRFIKDAEAQGLTVGRGASQELPEGVFSMRPILIPGPDGQPVGVGSLVILRGDGRSLAALCAAPPGDEAGAERCQMINADLLAADTPPPLGPPIPEGTPTLAGAPFAVPEGCAAEGEGESWSLRCGDEKVGWARLGGEVADIALEDLAEMITQAQAIDGRSWSGDETRCVGPEGPLACYRSTIPGEEGVRPGEHVLVGVAPVGGVKHMLFCAWRGDEGDEPALCEGVITVGGR